jgi:hypothetical protein
LTCLVQRARVYLGNLKGRVDRDFIQKSANRALDREFSEFGDTMEYLKERGSDFPAPLSMVRTWEDLAARVRARATKRSAPAAAAQHLLGDRRSAI